MTKGIISAERKIRGLDYLQTDAAINQGNSGGPAFSEDGQLIGLTVAGMFTSGGANLNLNYLIPIDDVFKHLNVPMHSHTDGKRYLTNKVDSIGNPLVRNAVEKLLGWLDKPIF